MKITEVECLILGNQYPFVRIYTDEGLSESENAFDVCRRY
ncbi:MAG: hypothetical protein Ct9H300mP11_28090 [Chloroflexota bacterium]|nr:MAG: hypothetical protein Ct9H300mP11_28090 [Chloroflexota bacterium]